MRKNKNTSKIIIATVVAILAMIISYSAFSNLNSQLDEKQKLIDVMQKTQDGNPQETFTYAVATDNLKAGEIVSEEDVDFKSFDTINTNAFDNRSMVVNKVLLQDINSGEVFTSAQIAKISSDDTSLKEGYRALTLPADNFQGRSDKMVPGSLIDIYSASGDSNWVLERVKILGLEGGDTITKATSITFEVSTDEISDFISNISKSKLVLVERNANDKKVVRHRAKKAYIPHIPTSAPSFTQLPDIPSSPPVSNFSGLPQPLQPASQSGAVELIEANVKSKVTFD